LRIDRTGTPFSGIFLRGVGALKRPPPSIFFPYRPPQEKEKKKKEKKEEKKKKKKKRKKKKRKRKKEEKRKRKRRREKEKHTEFGIVQNKNISFLGHNSSTILGTPHCHWGNFSPQSCRYFPFSGEQSTNQPIFL
jgi:hypothetical protein